mmetsp:Transcript_57743/g.154273  ORF Transcript_57743/g.154273 Transcript_57743/m.154273 type:complete len:394 (+) Transcript_57743:1487-2668(+)
MIVRRHWVFLLFPSGRRILVAGASLSRAGQVQLWMNPWVWGSPSLQIFQQAQESICSFCPTLIWGRISRPTALVVMIARCQFHLLMMRRVALTTPVLRALALVTNREAARSTPSEDRGAFRHISKSAARYCSRRMLLLRQNGRKTLNQLHKRSSSRIRTVVRAQGGGERCSPVGCCPTASPRTTWPPPSLSLGARTPATMKLTGLSPATAPPPALRAICQAGLAPGLRRKTKRLRRPRHRLLQTPRQGVCGGLTTINRQCLPPRRTQDRASSGSQVGVAVALRCQGWAKFLPRTAAMRLGRPPPLSSLRHAQRAGVPPCPLRTRGRRTWMTRQRTRAATPDPPTRSPQRHQRGSLGGPAAFPATWMRLSSNRSWMTSQKLATGRYRQRRCAPY